MRLEFIEREREVNAAIGPLVCMMHLTLYPSSLILTTKVVRMTLSMIWEKDFYVSMIYK